jgi:C4-dicarboxylate-specific signal transduction histidine kinase
VSRLRLLVRSGAAKKLRCGMISIIKNVLLLFDYNVNKSSIGIQIQMDEELPDVYVDEIQIQQILVNLIKNSMDSILECGQRYGRIDIRVATTPEELHVSVQDNGAGISADGLAHLFEPFYTSKAQGVGLGLSICKNIASAHGGTLVCASSQPGETRFLLTLPLSSIG